MKKYNTNQKQKVKKEKSVASDVSCDEKNCKGEMMIGTPEVKHPQLKTVSRAECGNCGWKGWV